MLRSFLAFTLALACCLSSAVVVAQPSDEVQAPPESVAQIEQVEQSQEPAEPEPTAADLEAAAAADYFMSDEHRQKIYEAKRKSASRAALLTLAFPGLGNIYAEQFLVAGLAFVAMAFAAVFVSYGLVTSQPKIAVTGLIVAGGAYGVGIVSSVAGVSAYNKQLRRGLKIEQAQLREAWTPMVSFRF